MIERIVGWIRRSRNPPKLTDIESNPSIKMLGDWLLYQEARSGDKEALVCGNERVTYSALAMRARVIASALQAMGVQVGDTVGMVVPTGIDCVVAFCGTLLAGAAVAPLDQHSRPHELKQVLTDLQPKALIVHADKASIVSSANMEKAILERILFINEGSACRKDSRYANNRQAILPSIESDLMPAVIFFTSGTTGKPKGVVHSHKGFLASIEARLESWRPNAEDRILCLITMNSALEWSAIVMTSIRCGATLVIAPLSDANDSVLKIREELTLIATEKITVLPGVPAIFQLILREHEQSKLDVSTLRVCWCASGQVSLPLLQATEQFFGVPLLVFFGMTEMCGTFLLNHLHAERKVGSVGTPAPGYFVEIRDDEGNILPRGNEHVGMMFVSGPSVMLGYLNQKALTAAVLKEGWICTGDLAYTDNDGYIFVLGRKDDRIDCAGTKIYPEEIETVIAKFPGVTEIAIVGMPSDVTGECVKAFVVLADSSVTENMLQKYCAHHLAAYKVPQKFEFIDKLPRTARGKIKRKFLKALVSCDSF